MKTLSNVVKKAYVAYKGDLNITMMTISKVMSELGIDHTLVRHDNGYSSRIGSNSKRADTLQIDIFGKLFSNDRYVELGACDLLSVVMSDHLSDEQRRVLDTHYHKTCIRRLMKEVAHHQQLLNSL